MTATDLEALDLALAEWVEALVALETPGAALRHEDGLHLVPASCDAAEGQVVGG